MKIETINGNPTRMLENEFTKGERTFVYVKTYNAEGKSYKLFKVTFYLGTKMEHTHYELFLVKFSNKHTKDTHTEYTHIEMYQSDEAFGYWAWNPVSEQAADEKVLELTSPNEFKKVFDEYQSPNEFEIRDRVRYLGNEFRTQGRNFKLLKQVGDYKVFAVGIDVARPSMKNIEVVKTSICEKHYLDECEEYDMIERYPSDSAWGRNGWSFTTLDAAEKHLRRLGL